MAFIASFWLLLWAGVIGWFLWKNYMKFYMMKNHPEQYVQMKERDDERMKQVRSEVGKAAAPVLMKLAERMLKK